MLYKESCQLSGHVSMGLSTFRNLWKSVSPHIKFMPPRTDVCPNCEKLSNAIKDTHNVEEKLEATHRFQEHLQHVQTEREGYTTCVKEARAEMEGREVSDPSTPVVPCSTDYSKVHYTFDYSQACTLPHHSRQVGPLYFLNPRKVQLFGVAIEGVKQQLNLLVDENETPGTQSGKNSKGPNSVISMLDHALSLSGFGEKEAAMHADNCAGK